MSLHLTDKVDSLEGSEPLVIAPHATLRAVAAAMRTKSVGALVVGTADRPRGIISERDVVNWVGQGADPDRTTAQEAMSAHVASVRVGDRIFEAVSQMMENNVRHLPVLDDHGHVVAMVSVRDLLHPLVLDAWGG